MASDAIAHASSISIASSNPRDFTKKKPANRSAKLKQCKRDARQKQWLSQVVKKNGSKGEANGGGGGGPRVELMVVGKEKGKSIEKLEIKSMNNDNDSGSPSNSPTSVTSSVLGSNYSGMNFTGSSSSSSSNSTSSSSSAGCYSGCISDEDDDGCLDDWEALADALAATEDKQKRYNPFSDSHLQSNENINVSELKRESEVNVRAWRSDDVFRPQSLPNLSKQFSFPMKSDRNFGHGRGGGSVWGCNVAQVPSSCPICYEDLDLTDTSFLPCLCGFRLCLFCHKRILEEDGRCPGCRKQYEQDATFRLARSCSMVTGS